MTDYVVGHCHKCGAQCLDSGPSCNCYQGDEDDNHEEEEEE